MSSAMFGDYGFVLGQKETEIGVVRQGYLGNRKITKTTMSRISAVAVMEQAEESKFELVLFHNPFCKFSIAPEVASSFATRQYVFKNPHAKKYSPWYPKSEII